MQKPTSKCCSRCQATKASESFHNRADQKDGLAPQCKDCSNARRKAWREANPERNRYRIQAWRDNNPDAIKDHDLRKNYGIGLAEYRRLFAKQNECCAICDRHQSEFQKALAVDHDHETGKVRGLLCGDCNIAIGLLQDSVAKVLAAASYLTRRKLRIA